MAKKIDPENRELLLAIPGKTAFNYVEAYKALRTNIKFISTTSGLKTIVVTSSAPAEGKSNVSVNLAINLAEDGQSVLLVDCDFRKPIIHKYLKLGHRFKGVTDILAEKATIEEAVVQFEDLGINVIVAGTVPPNPAELLASNKMRDFVEDVSDMFDYVIFDAPPINAVTDAAILGQIADGVVLVVKSEGVVKEASISAKNKLQSVGCNIIGVVLTDIEMKKARMKNSYSYYNYGYEYSSSDE